MSVPVTQGGAIVLPFPQVRRRRFIEKTAVRLLALPYETAEKTLVAALNQQCATMVRRGISLDLIARQRASLESAIRGELWRHVLTPDGAA